MHYSVPGDTYLSRVCALAQYAVLEANGEAKICTLTPWEPLNQFGYRFQYITTSTQGIDVQNGFESIRPLWICGCMKNGFPCRFSICLSISSSGLQVTFLADFNTQWFKQHVLQLLLLFGISLIKINICRVKTSIFGCEQAFSSQTHKMLKLAYYQNY